jgi:lipopolysaccharide export system protein LptA
LYTTEIKGQTIITKDSTFQASPDTTVLKDSFFITNDTAKTRNSVIQKGNDSFRIAKDAIDAIIDYRADDSSYTDILNRRAYLWGNAQVKYDGLDLTADVIVIDFEKRQLYARGRFDSTGRYVGRPNFKDGERETEADTMIYNFETKRGRTYGIALKEGDGYIYCNKVFRDDDKSIYSDRGKYTTCNNKDHPHFYLEARNLKIIPDKKIIFGPSNLVIEDIPTPLFIPFGMFPTKKEKKSGLIPFEYGMSGNYGPFLRNVGYHFAISDYVDASLSGDVYFRGSWRIAENTRYVKRYRYNGNFSIEFSKYLNGEREDPDFKINNTRSFAFKWFHSQDAKARPGSTFNASVNVQKNNFAQLNSRVPTAIVSNDFGSSVTYSKMLLRNKVNVSLGALHRQNTQTKAFSMSLPNLTVSVQRITPFSQPNALGKYKWYKDFGISYQLEFENRIDTKDSIFFSGAPIAGIVEGIAPGLWVRPPVSLKAADQFKQGIVHTLPITLGSYKFLKQRFSFTPSVSYKEFWYFNSVEKKFNYTTDTIDVINHYQFSRASEYSASGNVGTQIFGTYQFSSKKISAMRHTISPNVGFSYRPDYSNPRYGIFKEVNVNDSNDVKQKYSIYENGIKGGPGGGASGLINYSIGNNLQAKVLKKTDSSSVYENRSLIENLSISGNYNVLKDTQQLSNITVSGFTKLFNHLNVNANATLNPYAKKNIRNVTGDGYREFYTNQLEWANSRRIGTWTNASVMLNTNLNADMFRKKKSLDTAGKIRTKEDEEEYEDMLFNPNGYVNFDMPWSLDINYSMNYARQNYKTSYLQTFSFRGDFNLTPKWKVGCSSGYDFSQKKISYTQFEVSRLLHCWALNFSWIPDGIRKSFTFSIKANSSILQSLKVDKKRYWFDQ